MLMALALACCSLVTHGTFPREQAAQMYKRFLPGPVDDYGVVRVQTLKRIAAAHKALQDPSAFLVVADDGECMNAFICDRPNAYVHRVQICIVLDDEQHDIALDAFAEWHKIHFEGVELMLA